MIAITLLAYTCNHATNLLPLILGLFFKISGTSSCAMTMLSNVGLCISGRTVECLKKWISDDAIGHAAELMKSGRLFCTTFDNINIYLWKFQQCITNKHSMIHATNCAILAIDEEDLDVQCIENLDIKLALHGQWAEGTFSDILPSEYSWQGQRDDAIRPTIEGKENRCKAVWSFWH